MKVGEIRKICIHPSLAYGVHTLLEKAIYLTSIVKLHRIYDSGKQKFPSLQPKDLSYLLDQNFYAECEAKYIEGLRGAGQQKRKFLLLCADINLELIAKAFQTDEATLELSREEYDAINHLLWKIYFSNII